jgi:hypothetical protein
MNPYEKILKELATGLLEITEIKPNFSNDALLDATLIFQSVFMDKLYDAIENLSLEVKEIIVVAAGEELKKFILKYTDLDTIELTKNYGK